MTRSDRSTARNRQEEVRDRPAPPGSLPIRLAETALRHPVTSAGAFLSLAMIGVIFGNALGNQPARHPHPFFQTRSTVDAARPAAVPLPQPAPQNPAAAAAPQAVPAATPAATPVPRPRPVGALEQPAGLAELQVALRDHGLYSGPLDGILGPATVEAIRAFERRIGAPQTGEPSELLLASARALRTPDTTATGSLRTQTARRADPAPAAQSAPVATAPANTPVAASPARIAAVETIAAPVASEEVANLPMVDEVSAVVPTGAIRRAAREPLAQGGDVRIQRAQRGLVAAGYGPLKADGRYDDKTGTAIRRFEIDHGWIATGRVSERLLANLVDPGAQRP